MAVENPQLIFFVSGIIGFGPAIAVMYHALRTFDYPFTDRPFFQSNRVFMGLAVGMVLGTVSGLITIALQAGIVSLETLILSILLLALFEESFKVVYLNRKGYRGKFDTTFYGLSLGVGMGALIAAGNAYVNGDALLLPGIALPLAVFAASIGLIQATTGAIIGYGCSKKDIIRSFLQAISARAIHALILLPFIVWFGSDPRPGPAMPAFGLVAALVFALLLYMWVYRTVLQDTLPIELQRERRRTARKRRTSS